MENETTLSPNIDIEFNYSEYNENYRVADWFDGHWPTIWAAEDAETPEEAERILRDAYLGPDINGVYVTWEIVQ